MNGSGRGSRLGLFSVACLASRDSVVCLQDARPFRVAASLELSKHGVSFGEAMTVLSDALEVMTV